ncbi:MAG: SdiA-regulated domain-containing protein [Candidatus Krumholzibacteriota bacterium]
MNTSELCRFNRHGFIWLSIILISGCADNTPTETEPPPQEEPELELISTVNIHVDEPSGLCFSIDKQALWTVSDQTRKVYKVDFGGNVLETLAYTGNDLEGIAIDPGDSTLWVAEEYLSQIVQLDNLGNELQRIDVTGAAGNSGLEGVTINTSNGHFFLLKEQDPGVLIELDGEFNLLTYKRINFAYDFSGIYYESHNQHLWIVSDQNEKVYKCDLTGSVLTEYPIDVDKAEGIAVDYENARVYIVSDSYEKLYLYSIID